MDSFSRYNKIKMYLDNQKHIVLDSVGDVLLHYYALSIKNARSNYQHARNTIFCETVECYIDDIAIESHKEDHLYNLRLIDIMQS